MRLPGGKSSAHWPPTRFLMTHTPQSCTIFRLVCGSHRIKKLLARTMRAARYLSTQAHGVGVSSKTFILPAKGKVDFCTLRFAKSTAFEYVMRGASLVCVWYASCMNEQVNQNQIMAPLTASRECIVMRAAQITIAARTFAVRP
jgi:hypothetical protein